MSRRKSNENDTNLGFEEKLWAAADKLQCISSCSASFFGWRPSSLGMRTDGLSWMKQDGGAEGLKSGGGHKDVCERQVLMNGLHGILYDQHWHDYTEVGGYLQRMAGT